MGAIRGRGISVGERRVFLFPLGRMGNMSVGKDPASVAVAQTSMWPGWVFNAAMGRVIGQAGGALWGG